MNLEQKEAHHAKLALEFMEKHRVSPNPEAFAVWYYYSLGNDKKLVQEVNQAMAHSVGFSREICSNLYQNFVLDTGRQQKTLDDAAENAQKVLTEMLSVATGLSGETQSYNNNLDTYIEKIATDLGDRNVKEIFKDLVAATATLKSKSEVISQRLEESTKEIEGLRKNLEQVTHESQRDFLTGVYNRKTFEKMFDEQVETATEQSTPVSLLMLDIDHFKQFNDKFGHLLGDEVLKIVARVLMNTLKGRDVVARFGGEEFIVMLPETNIESAMIVAEILRNNIASKELKQKNTGENYGAITISIGVAHFRPGDDMQSLIKRADDALYKSKRNGRNCVTREE